MLSIENASIKFEEKELFSDFNLSLDKGEIGCIYGVSGKGKTSLLNAVMGFIPLYKGTITVDNTLLSLSTIDKIRKLIAWIPQELALPSEWVRDMVHIPFDLKSNKAAAFQEERLFMNFDALDLDKKVYDKRVNEISGGQRQRVMIAVAAMLNKPLYIIDEPTSALDDGSSDKVLNFLINEVKGKGKAVLAVSHDKLFINGCNKQFKL